GGRLSGDRRGRSVHDPPDRGPQGARAGVQVPVRGTRLGRGAGTTDVRGEVPRALRLPSDGLRAAARPGGEVPPPAVPPLAPQPSACLRRTVPPRFLEDAGLDRAPPQRPLLGTQAALRARRPAYPA